MKSEADALPSFHTDQLGLLLRLWQTGGDGVRPGRDLDVKIFLRCVDLTLNDTEKYSVTTIVKYVTLTLISTLKLHAAFLFKMKLKQVSPALKLKNGQNYYYYFIYYSFLLVFWLTLS